jgi:putative transcriptional regulator
MLKNTVKEWRQKKKISKAHLARRIGVCRSYVSKLEQQDLQPSGEVMFRIAAYFKLRIEDIFSTGLLPNGNNCGVTPPVRPSGMGLAKDKSPVGPAAKIVALSVALASRRK